MWELLKEIFALIIFIVVATAALVLAYDVVLEILRIATGQP
jgi:hypothetical protein